MEKTFILMFISTIGFLMNFFGENQLTKNIGTVVLSVGIVALVIKLAL